MPHRARQFHLVSLPGMRPPQGEDNPSRQWLWTEALRGAMCLAPGALLCLTTTPTQGLLTGICCLPLALLGVRGPRRSRLKMPWVAVVLAAAYVLGVHLENTFPRDVVAVAIAAGLAANWASHLRLGVTAPAVLLPVFVVAVYGTDPAGWVTAGLLLAGGLWAGAVNLLWPPLPPLPPPVRVMDDPRRRRLYAGLLGGALVATLLAGYLLHIPHPAWGAIATVLIMRPREDMLRLRGVGRVASVLIGILLAWALFPLLAAPWALGGVVLLAGALIIGWRQGRWCLVPGGLATLLMLLYGAMAPESFDEYLYQRLLQTILGAASALFFGLGVSGLAQRIIHGEAENR